MAGTLARSRKDCQPDYRACRGARIPVLRKCSRRGRAEPMLARPAAGAASEPSFRNRLLTALSETPARPSELADKLDRGRPQVSETLNSLTERGLVTSAKSAIDGRSRLFELTDRGRAELAT